MTNKFFEEIPIFFINKLVAKALIELILPSVFLHGIEEFPGVTPQNIF